MKASSEAHCILPRPRRALQRTLGQGRVSVHWKLHAKHGQPHPFFVRFSHRSWKKVGRNGLVFSKPLVNTDPSNHSVGPNVRSCLSVVIWLSSSYPKVKLPLSSKLSDYPRDCKWYPNVNQVNFAIGPACNTRLRKDRVSCRAS